MRFPFFLTAALGLASSIYGQIVTNTPSHGSGVSYSVNIPELTASSGTGPIFLQLEAPDDLKWIALGQGDSMTSGNMFIVYAAPGGNVTLSPRRAIGPFQPLFNSSIEAYLLPGSGVQNGLMTANIRCDNCMTLLNGKSIMDDKTQSSSWIWGITEGGPLISADINETIFKHDYHGIFTLDLSHAIGGDSANPFFDTSHNITDYTPHSKQQQINDTILHRKRIAHGVMSSVAFVLLFPGFALTLFLFPGRRTVMWIHAPLQGFALLLSLAGFALGVSVAIDIRETAGYHPIIGYVVMFGIVLIQPALGIMQHVRFKRGLKSSYGLIHRWLGRILTAIGIINGGIGFHYAASMNPDIPPASPISYGGICGGVGIIYVGVIWWRTAKNKREAKRAQLEASLQEKSTMEDAYNRSHSTLVESTDVSTEKAWLP